MATYEKFLIWMLVPVISKCFKKVYDQQNLEWLAIYNRKKRQKDSRLNINNISNASKVWTKHLFLVEEENNIRYKFCFNLQFLQTRVSSALRCSHSSFVNVSPLKDFHYSRSTTCKYYNMYLYIIVDGYTTTVIVVLECLLVDT